MKKRKNNKKKRVPEPRWVGPLSLFLGFLIYMVLFGILMGEIPHPVGHKGEGLLFSLMFYVPVRFIFQLVYTLKARKSNDPESRE